MLFVYLAPKNVYFRFVKRHLGVDFWSKIFRAASFCQLATLSTCHFVNFPFLRLSISSTCHFVNMTLCQLAIFSTCHFVNSPFCQLAISSTCHFFNLPLCQRAILSTCHFVNLPFCQHAIFVNLLISQLSQLAISSICQISLTRIIVWPTRPQAIPICPK